MYTLSAKTGAPPARAGTARGGIRSKGLCRVHGRTGGYLLSVCGRAGAAPAGAPPPGTRDAGERLQGAAAPGRSSFPAAKILVDSDARADLKQERVM